MAMSQQPTEMIEQDRSRLKVESIAKDEEGKRLSEKEVPLEANQEGTNKDLPKEEPKTNSEAKDSKQETKGDRVKEVQTDLLNYDRDLIWLGEKKAILAAFQYYDHQLWREQAKMLGSPNDWTFEECCKRYPSPLGEFHKRYFGDEGKMVGTEVSTKGKEIDKGDVKKEKQRNQSLWDETKIWSELSKLEEKRSGLKTKMKEIQKQIANVEQDKVAKINEILNAALESCVPDQWVWIRPAGEDGVKIRSKWILTQITSFKKSHDSFCVTFKNNLAYGDTYHHYESNFAKYAWVPSICGSLSLSQALISALAALNGEKAEFVPTM
jgi:hypothetical protein